MFKIYRPTNTFYSKKDDGDAILKTYEAQVIVSICRKTSFRHGGMHVKQTASLQGSLRLILKAMVIDISFKSKYNMSYCYA